MKAIINNLLLLSDDIENSVKSVYPEMIYNIMRDAAEEIETIEQEKEKLQARIDSLMIKYCPEDMTKEQVDRWAKKQAKAIPYTMGWKRMRNKE